MNNTMMKYLHAVLIFLTCLFLGCFVGFISGASMFTNSMAFYAVFSACVGAVSALLYVAPGNS
jgi:uncharacterized membrane protein